MSIDFWTDANMSEFWQYVKMLLQTISPGIMITAAVAGVGILLPIVIRSFRKADDDEDDYEVRHY